MKKKILMLLPKKCVFFFTTLCLTTGIGYSQNSEKCEKVVSLTVEALNTGSAEKILPYLSEDFTIMTHKGDIAKTILAQLTAQLGKVNSFEKTGENSADNELTLNYSFEYEKTGQQTVTFIFDGSNKLKSAELAKIAVKAVNMKETVVEKNERDIIKIPFRLVEKLIIVDDVLIDGEKKSFIFDSGCPMVLFNKRVENQSQSSAKGVGGSISNMDIQKVNHLDWNGIKMTNQDVLVADISHLEEAAGEKIYGLIGYVLVKDYDILYDYQNKELLLIKPDKFDDFRQENFPDSKQIKVPLQMAQHIPVVRIEINGLQLAMGIDCGATQNMIPDKYLPQLKKQLKKQKSAEVMGADKNITQTTTGLLKKMTVGKKTFIKTATTFGSVPVPESVVKYEGLIGYEILSQQKTLISAARGEIVFIE
jgi:hypothetical protein